MQAPEPVLRIVWRAFGVACRNLAVLIPLALFVAVPATAAREYCTDAFLAWLSQPGADGTAVDLQQAPILAMALAEVVVLPWDCIAGAFAAAALVYVYMQSVRGLPVHLGEAFDQALVHWRRLVVPFTLASLIIWVGSIVIIPGVFYTLLYAFVVPVAVLDPAVKHVLRRSTRLTRGQRGRIFRTYMVFLPWWGWYATVGALVLASKHWSLRYLAPVCDELFGFVIAFALIALYLERMKQLEELLASEGKEPPGGHQAMAVDTVLGV